MALLWTPDFCPPGAKPCVIDVRRDWSGANGFQNVCPHHKKLFDGGASVDQVFNAILESSRAKEVAREEAKLELGLDKETPAPDFRVDPDGTIVVMINNPGKTAVVRARAQGRIANRPAIPGASKVRIE